MKEEFYMPGWIKAVLGFALVMLGLLFTFIVFRFFPVKKEAGFDGMGSLIYSFFALGMVLILYVVGLLMDKKHPYTLFFICIGMFVLLLAGIRIIYL